MKPDILFLQIAHTGPLREGASSKGDQASGHVCRLFCCDVFPRQEKGPVVLMRLRPQCIGRLSAAAGHVRGSARQSTIGIASTSTRASAKANPSVDLDAHKHVPHRSFRGGGCSAARLDNTP